MRSAFLVFTKCGMKMNEMRGAMGTSHLNLGVKRLKMPDMCGEKTMSGSGGGQNCCAWGHFHFKWVK